MPLMYTITKLVIALLLVAMATGRAAEDFKEDLDHEDLNEDSNQMEKKEAQMEEAPEGNADTGDDAGCLSGPVGPRGYRGARGRNGRDGRDGKTGLAGFDGEHGEAGLPGKDGKDGQAGPPGPSGNGAPGSGAAGVTYVRWGRTECKDTAQILYKGITGGAHFTQVGSGANYLCLPEDPEFDWTDGPRGQRGYIDGAEYQVIENDGPLKPIHDHDAPCAVCAVVDRGMHVMIPAKMTCPDGWTEEYHGYLMSEKHSHNRSEFICVDHDPETRPNGERNTNGALLYLVEARCSDPSVLPCDLYPNGNELTCVVCTK